MIATNYKFVGITPPAAVVNNAAIPTAVVDTLGARYCSVFVYLGALDVAVPLLKLQESDALSGGSLLNGTDVPGTVVGTDSDMSGVPSVLPAATDDFKLYLFEIDLRGRKRYLDLQLTGGNGTSGTFATAFALLQRLEAEPDRASKKGAALAMRVPGK